MSGNWGLIDLDTPQDVYTKADYYTGKNWQLIFSDEFNVDGRTFYPGDDPYWEAVDLHYWGTNNMEWYDPAAITTKNGSLVITLSKKANHELDYQGGMMSTWNKFCFTGGLIEAAVVLPGANNVVGLWPAIWTMGNLGRAGYGASLDGMVRHVLRRPAKQSIDSSRSGHTHMTRATSAQLQTRLSTAFHLLQRRMVTPPMAAYYRIFQASVSPGAHVLVNPTLGPCIPMVHMSGVQHQKSISSKLRFGQVI